MIIRKLSRLSTKFLTVRKLSRLSGNFPNCLEPFQTVWKLFQLSGNFPNYPKTFQTVQKLCRLLRNLSRCLESFQTYAMFVLVFWTNFVDTRKNFPVGNADAPTGFFCLCDIWKQNSCQQCVLGCKCFKIDPNPDASVFGQTIS